jgi:pyruvate/2-oxoglutarate dehydrogenase complex dihydrolipoamide dehydrogenase (E3) component
MERCPRPCTHAEALEMDAVPDHLDGGGYEGLEFAQTMLRFESKVTLIEHNGHLMYQEDVTLRSSIARLITLR